MYKLLERGQEGMDTEWYDTPPTLRPEIICATAPSMHKPLLSEFRDSDAIEITSTRELYATPLVSDRIYFFDLTDSKRDEVKSDVKGVQAAWFQNPENQAGAILFIIVDTVICDDSGEYSICAWHMENTKTSPTFVRFNKWSRRDYEPEVPKSDRFLRSLANGKYAFRQFVQ